MQRPQQCHFLFSAHAPSQPWQPCSMQLACNLARRCSSPPSWGFLGPGLSGGGGPLIQQVVAPRPRSGLEPCPNLSRTAGRRVVLHPARLSTCTSSRGSRNSCLCHSFLRSDAHPPLLPSLTALHCWFWQAGLGTSSVPREDSAEAQCTHVSCGSTGRSRAQARRGVCP